MSLDYLYLALTVALLWFPLALLLSRRMRRELRDSARKELVTLPALLRSPWAWIDLLRATAAMGLLIYFVLPRFTPAEPTRADNLLLLGARLLPPLVGVWIQTMITGSRRLRLAPLFYLLGVTIMVLPWQVSLFGGLLGLTLTGMLRYWTLVFWLMPATLVAASMLFRQIGPPVATVALMYLIPGLLGLTPERSLAWIFVQYLPQSTKGETSSAHRRHHRMTTGAKL